MLFIPKISKRENLPKRLQIITSMYEEIKSHSQIGDYLKLEKSTTTSIFYCCNKQHN